MRKQHDVFISHNPESTSLSQAYASEKAFFQSLYSEDVNGAVGFFNEVISDRRKALLINAVVSLNEMDKSFKDRVGARVLKNIHPRASELSTKKKLRSVPRIQ